MVWNRIRTRLQPLLACIFVFFYQGICSQDPLLYRTYKEIMLTHELTPAGPIPTAMDPNGVYPYMSFHETSDRPVARQYQFIELENDHLKATICPDLGGKVMSLKIKPSMREVLYVPGVIRPTRILPRFSFVAGGIEVSFPISHTPVQNEKLLYNIEKTGDRVYVTCGERELRFGMQWSVEYSLGRKDTFLTQRVVYHNPGKESYPWMSWSNAAIPSSPDTEFHFPDGKVISHDSKLDTIRWSENGPKKEREIMEMTGYFWLSKDVNAFGVFNPDRKIGLYHLADRRSAPGVKLWSYGMGKDSIWSRQSTARQESYIEIQGGPIKDQSIKLMLGPKELKSHTEFWLPTAKPLPISELHTPVLELRPVREIPLFGWARKKEVAIWETLQDVFQSGTALPAPPEFHDNNWPPSGMDDLDLAFEYAIENSQGGSEELWRYYYGTWLAGRGKVKEAVSQLEACTMDIAKPLLARLYAGQSKFPKAADVLKSVESTWLQIHPQVIVHRDRILRKLGRNTLDQRAFWLGQVDALNDEVVIERRVQLLIDQDQVVKAKKLLLSTPFQLVHQSYRRHDLWKQICSKLNEPYHPVPASLGEDNLATFGSYREFDN